MGDQETPDELTDEQKAYQQRHQKWLVHQETIQGINCTNLPEYHEYLKKWLYLEPTDIAFIDVALAALLDREIPGDPVWLYLIAPPGGVKSELLRAFRVYNRAYTLDTLTTSTFVSGLSEKDKETGERVPVAGILRDLDGRTVIVKDFTTILNSSEETKTEIYGQLRSIYDGYFEKAFGTMRRKVSVEAVIGLLVGVTPVIDKYTRMQSSLGERFLKIRNNPDRLKAATRALENGGKERQMRAELARATETFLQSLDFTVIPEISSEYREDILKMAMYVGYMRANVWETYENGRVVDMELMGSEVPTRLAKQFKHLARLLAIVRGRKYVSEEDMKTLGRVARDTAETKKQAIIAHYKEWGGRGLEVCFDPSDIAGHVSGLFKVNTRNHMTVLQALGCMYVADNGRYGLTDEFKSYVKAVYRIPPPPLTLPKKPKNGSFGKPTKREGVPDEPGRLRVDTKQLRIYLRPQKEALTDEEIAESLNWSLERTRKILAVTDRDGATYQPRPGYWRVA